MALRTRVYVKWHGKGEIEKATRKMKSNAERAGMFLEGYVVKSLSKGQPARRSGNRLVGLRPSRPGEPPRLLHGLLRNSISHRVDRDAKHVDVYIGAHTPYARALELGDPKATSRARASSSKRVTSLASGLRTAGAGLPRPYLRPAIKRNRDKAIRILVSGLFKTVGK